MHSNRHRMSPLGISFIYFITVALIPTGAAWSQSAEEKGFEIAARSDRSDRGYGDSEVRMTMVSRNEAGEETERSLTLRFLENTDENFGDKILVVFETPEDVAGTALLSHANILVPDDLWLYLPALGRVTQINSANRTGPFAGSEFSFEDFTAQELNKFAYRFLSEEPCGDSRCDVVERIPRYEDSGYSKQIGWFDQETFQLHKVEFYARRSDLLKTLTLDDYRQYEGRYWRPHLLAIENNQTGKTTELIYADYRFNIGVAAADFESEALGSK